jgi:3-hydroxyisobutyrate dehydrogenase-like beta-hydroxyacid dehydrogenase
MARNIAQKANLLHPLIIQNRTVQRAHDLAASLDKPGSVRVVESVQDAVQPADAVFTSLGDDKSVQAIYEDILKTPGGVNGKLFVETSTVLPETTNAVCEMVLAAGGEFVASPGMSAGLRFPC